MSVVGELGANDVVRPDDSPNVLLVGSKAGGLLDILLSKKLVFQWGFFDIYRGESMLYVDFSTGVDGRE